MRSDEHRSKLLAARTYYIRTDGNDANTGLANTSGAAFLTLQRAVNEYQSLDCNGFDVTLKIADGTYTAGAKITQRIGAGNLYITGNTSTPANVLINTSAASDFPIWANGHPAGSIINLNGVKLQTTQSFCLFVDRAAYVTFQNTTFHSTGFAHIYTETLGKAQCVGSYSITAGAVAHICIIRQGTYQADATATATISGTPNFTTAFCYMLGLGYLLINSAVTWSGSATGKRYDIQSNAVCDTQGSGATFFPGNASGTTATGGVYI